MKKLFFLMLSVLFSCMHSYAQVEDNSIMEGDTTSGVMIHADPRLDILMIPELALKKNYIAPGSKVIRSAKGFRVQIYNGSDKNTAIKRKVDFMRRFPSVKTYMTYTQPVFRIKVGDFMTRKDAQEFMFQLNGMYSPLMVVPDYIVINTFHK